jgi:GTPase SAR1 family protein
MGAGTSSASSSAAHRRAAHGSEAAAASLHFRVVVVGPQGVGKTALVRRYLCNEFRAVAPSEKAVRAEVGLKFFDSEPPVSMEITDIPSDFLMDIIDVYMEGMDGAVVVADSTNPVTFREIALWREQFLGHYRKTLAHDEEADDLYPIVLAVNKSDEKECMVTDEEVKDSARAFKLDRGFLVSSRLDRNVDGVFGSLLALMLARRRRQIERGGGGGGGGGGGVTSASPASSAVNSQRLEIVHDAGGRDGKRLV